MRPQTMQPVTRSFDTHTSLAQGLCCRLKEGCSFIHAIRITMTSMDSLSLDSSFQSLPPLHRASQSLGVTYLLLLLLLCIMIAQSSRAA